MTPKNPIRTVLPLVALAIMILFLPAAAVDMPGPQPGPANATTLGDVTDLISVNFYAYGGMDPSDHDAVTLEAGESAGFGIWHTTGWENYMVPWAPTSPQAPATITSTLGATATLILNDARNGGPYAWSAPHSNLPGDGNGDLMDGHCNGTYDPGDGSQIFDMTVSDIPYSSPYDVIIYMGANAGQFGNGTGKIVFNGGAEQGFTLTSGEFAAFSEITDGGTPGNYIVYPGVTGPSFTVRVWGNGFNHLGPTGFQIYASDPLAPDISPPSPDPATFALAPAAISDRAISMTATIGSDITGPIEYYFAETSGNPGPTESGWQTLPFYTDSGLTASTLYTYTVTMRDRLGNTTAASTAESATTTAPGGGHPLKIFILAGQSNMEGHGEISPRATPGTLEYLVNNDAATYGHLDDGGSWVVRSDVWISYLRGGSVQLTGELAPGYGAGATTIGPELQFGHVMGDHYDQQVLLIKTAWGGKSLAVDFRPPSSGGDVGPYYRQMMDAVTDVLSNLTTYFPAYNTADGFEIAGFGWHQGWNDRVTPPHAAEYEVNMANFITDVRAELATPGLPFVIATTGMGGGTADSAVEFAQLAMKDFATYPQFEGNVSVIDTRGFWRNVVESPSDQIYHWNRNARTYIMIGDAMGREMTGLLSGYSVDAGPDMITWSEKPVPLNATVEEGVTVSSYSWSADPAAGVVFSDAAIEDPSVTITKATGAPSSVTLTLTVDDGKDPVVQDTLMIAIYDDACKAAIGTGLAPHYTADYDQDCMIGLDDFSVMVSSWLHDSRLDAFAAIADHWLADYRLTGPSPNILMGHWGFDETTGDIATDSTVHGYDGQVLNGGTWQPTGGKIGGALALDGVDDEVTLPAEILDPTEAFSVFMWVKLEEKLGTKAQILFQHNGSGRSFLYRQATDEKLCSYFGGTQTVSASAVFGTTGQWLHLGMTYDKTTLKMYVDGQLQASRAITGEPASAPFIVGAFKAGANKAERANWAGLIDNLRVYRRALTPGEITAIATD